jgi:spermidine synthase
MNGLHLVGDLYECRCDPLWMLQTEHARPVLEKQVAEAGLTLVSSEFFAFEGGGWTAMLLLAESHLAIHTWPELKAVTLDVYVCNYQRDNATRARKLFDAAVAFFDPKAPVSQDIQRGDLAGRPGEGALILEWLNDRHVFGLRAANLVDRFDSQYQRVEILENEDFGRLFRLDGRFMTSERDEFHYHEPMIHPALISHAEPQSVLILGGGDGGAAEEVLKHPSVQRVVVAELDEAVVRLAREHLQAIHKGALDDPRVEVVIGDGAAFVAETAERFDAVILDLTDPDTPAGPLYAQPFFRTLRRVMRPGAMVTLHIGSPVYGPQRVRETAAALHAVFKVVRPLRSFVPLYGSEWMMAVASHDADPLDTGAATVAERLAQRGITGLQHYNPAMHAAMFALPNYVQELVDA